MDEAFVIEQAERKARRDGRPIASLGKHGVEAESSETAAKRAKLEPIDEPPSRLAPTAAAPMATGREIDISPLPEQQVIEMVIRGLQAISAEALTQILNVSYNYDCGDTSDGGKLISRTIARLSWRTGQTLYPYCVNR